MKISVIIPVYNVERFLVRCLDSVLAAAAAAPCETEIICVNDGATDGSANLLARYADRVLIITKPNGGLGSARNAGLNVMTGDYALFVDSDDWIPSHAIATFARVAQESHAELVVSTSVADGDRGMTACPCDDTAAWCMRARDWIVGKKVQYSVCNKLYAASLWKDRRFGETLYEDYPVVTSIFCAVARFAAISAPLYGYCRNANACSIVRSPFSRKKLDSSLIVVRQVLDLCVGSTPDVRAFAWGQAVDGLSSTVGQVYKSHDAMLAHALGGELAALESKWPSLRRALRLKARFRLWRMGL